MAAAGATAAAERGLARLIERLEAEDGPEKVQSGRLVAELKDLSNIWRPLPSARSQELVRRLGCQMARLAEGTCMKAVAAFGPLGEDVKRHMALAAACLNAWLGESLQAASEGQEQGCRVLAEGALEKLEEPLRRLEEVPYVFCCYRRAADAYARVRFLLSLALALRAATEQTVNGDQSAASPVREMAEKLARQFFHLPQGNVMPSWLDCRLARYDRTWRKVRAVAAAAGLDLELRRRLGRAVQAALPEDSPWLQLSPWPMSSCSVARVLRSFVAMRLSVEDAEQRWLVECPEHSLQPGALLFLFHALEWPFEVDPDLGPEGAVRLTEAWDELKGAADKDEEIKEEIVEVSSLMPIEREEPTPLPTMAQQHASQEAQQHWSLKSRADVLAQQSRDRSRSRSRSQASLQPKLQLPRPGGTPAATAPPAVANAQDLEASNQRPAAFSKSLAASSAPAPPSAKASLQALVPVTVPAKLPPPAAAPHAPVSVAGGGAPPPPPAHAAAHAAAPGGYYYPMGAWGHHPMPGMPPGMMPGHGHARPGAAHLGPMGSMLPQQYIMQQIASMAQAQLPGSDGKKKKEKKEKKKDKKDAKPDAAASSSSEKKKKKKKEKGPTKKEKRK